MSKVLEIAEAVAAALADHGAEVQFIPEFALRGTAETRVVIVPAGTEFRALSRGLHVIITCCFNFALGIFSSRPV